MSAVTILEHVYKRFGRREALTDVDLMIAAGEIVGLVGPNGAGKTTLLRITAGLLRPSSGTVRVSVPPGVRSYFAGEQTLPPHIAANRWCALWGARHSGAGPTERIKHLSRGTRQRVGLVAALARAPRLVLLDEPWEGLDPDAARWLTAVLRRLSAEGSAVLVSSHRMFDLAEACDRCVFLAKEPAQPSTDIYMAARTFLGMCAKDTPSAITSFFASCLLTRPSTRPSDAGDLHEEFDKLLLRHVGKPTYRPLSMPPERTTP